MNALLTGANVVDVEALDPIEVRHAMFQSTQASHVCRFGDFADTGMHDRTRLYVAGGNFAREWLSRRLGANNW